MSQKSTTTFPITCDPGCSPSPDETDPTEARRTTRAWWGIGGGAVLAGNAMMFGLAINTSDASPAARLGLHWGLLGAALLAFLLLGPALLAESWRQLRQRRLTIEALFLAGLAGAAGASICSMATGHGPVYFETVIVLLVVYSLGRQLTRVSQRRAWRAIQAWETAPAECELLDPTGATRRVPVEQVGVGDTALVHPGRMIPVDGVIATGEAFVQESQLTGEFFAARRAPGDRVYAGAFCVDGTLAVRATAPGHQRRIDLLARAVARARQTPSTLQTEADRLTGWFLPLTLALAGLTFAGWTVARGWPIGLFNALAVLLVACPCAMGFATPVALWSMLGRLARLGLLPRRGDLIEALAGIDTVVFDKTGTLTEPRATLADLVFADDLPLPREELRRLIGAIERASDHPIAAAFHEVGRLGPRRLDRDQPPLRQSNPADRIDLPGQIDLPNPQVRPLPGRGIHADCTLSDGRPCQLAIGSEALLETSAARQTMTELSQRLAAPATARRILILLDGQLVALAAVEERLLETTPAALQALAELGVTRVLMTGDRPERAGLPGFDAIHAGLTPEDKVRLVHDLRMRGLSPHAVGAPAHRVLFIGDGLNDAVAMAESDAAIAPADSAPLAGETAGALLLAPDLMLIPQALRLCRRARRAIRSNLRLAAAYNAVGMALACAGLLHPVAAAVLMTASSLAVSLRALRLLEDEAENTPPPPPAEPVVASQPVIN